MAYEDLSRHEKAEHALQQMVARLNEAQQVAHIGSWEWDLRRNQGWWSEELYRLFDLVPGQAAPLFREDLWGRYLHPEDQAAAWAIFTKAVTERTPFKVHARLLFPDGRIKHIERRGRVEYAPDGSLLRTCGTTQDITQNKRAEEELRQARKAAEVAHQAKSEFLAHMSHEIRTPLYSVLGLTQMISREPLSHSQGDMIRRIQEAGQSLLAIIDDIQDLSRIEAGKIQLKRRTFDLSDVLLKVDGLLGYKAKSEGLTFDIDRSRLPPGQLVGDDLRLEQILTNLIGNAIKFTTQGGIKLLIHPLAPVEGGLRLRFEVQDTGIGITPEVMATLFKPFVQGDSIIAQRLKGSGLGLAISKHLVNLMGGAIGAESRPDHGSTFWFELPYGYQSVTSSTATLQAGQSPAQAPSLGGLHFQVVDLW